MTAGTDPLLLATVRRMESCDVKMSMEPDGEGHVPFPLERSIQELGCRPVGEVGTKCTRGFSVGFLANSWHGDLSRERGTTCYCKAKRKDWGQVGPAVKRAQFVEGGDDGGGD